MSLTQTATPVANDAVGEVKDFVLAELDHFGANFKPDPTALLTFYSQVLLKAEPFIGFLRVEGSPDYKHMLICRNYTPFDLKAKHPECDFVSYLSPAGRLMSSFPGDQVVIATPGGKVSLKILQRSEFFPHKENGHWDAVRNHISWISDKRYVPSLRQYDPAKFIEKVRAVADRVQLPDQAILDIDQNEVFRQPLNRTLVISGAPGTGKTTVLIKRLAQKTKHAFLTEAEQKIVSVEDWQENRNWVMFTPNDLLKNYVKESLGKEHLPASDDTVKVWSQYRMDLLRRLGFLKSGAKGYFTLLPAGHFLLKRANNTDAVALTKGFHERLGVELDDFYRDEYRKFGENIRDTLATLRGGMQTMMERALDYLTGVLKGEERHADPMAVGQDLRSKAQKIDMLCRFAEGFVARGDRRNGAPLTPTAMHQFHHRVRSELHRLADIQINEAFFPGVSPAVGALVAEIRKLAEATNFTNVFNRLPMMFHAYRKSDEGAKFYREEAQTQINERKIDGIEMDALLWVALELAADHESIVAEVDGDKTTPSPAGVLLAQRQGMVTVDEATDFSAVELGCMRRLSKPAFESFTICGDPMQRLTTSGIQDWSDIEAMVGKFTPSVLHRSYRQTARLLEVAKDLYRNSMEQDPPFSSAYASSDADPAPLAFKSTPAGSAEAWITERIIEISQAVTSASLPTIGVFIPDGANENEWVARLNERLLENAIAVEGSGNGMSLGNTNRVRVFPVSCIKGLEFEAAFFVDIDRMADKAPTLIDKYLYVGLSRARSYLGVTYSTQFPRKLSCVRKHFSDQPAFAAS